MQFFSFIIFIYLSLLKTAEKSTNPNKDITTQIPEVNELDICTNEIYSSDEDIPDMQANEEEKTIEDKLNTFENRAHKVFEKLFVEKARISNSTEEKTSEIDSVDKFFNLNKSKI